MAFTGPYPTIFSGHATAMLISATTFSGGVTNAGTIGPGGVTITSSTFLTGGFLNTNLISGATANGIGVLSSSTIHGAIVDSGTILAAKDGILVSGGVVSGGIRVGSHGVISAFSSAIAVKNTTKFAGGIDNAGAISAGANVSGSGIRVDGTVFTFAGGITNSGTITIIGTGNGISDFAHILSGGITNTGTISIFNNGDGVHVDTVTSVFGNISNSGTISASAAAVFFERVSAFAGNIVNAGKITGGSNGAIDVQNVTAFSGSIINSAGGVISAQSSTAIRVANNVSIFTGAIVNAGTVASAINSAGGQLDVVVSATDSGTLTNSGTITIDDLATLTVGSSIVNVGAINLQITAGATLAIEAASGTNVSLTGAGKVTLSSTSDKISIGSGVTLTNVNNTIAGVGTIGTPGGPGALVNSGTIDAHGFLDTLFIDVRVINKGVMEATGPVTLAVNSGGTNFNVVEASGGHVEITAPFANSKTIEALSGEIIISGGTVANSSTGFVLVSGSVATLFIESGTIAGGKLQSLAGGKIIAENGNNVLSGVTIASGTLVQDTGDLTLDGGTISKGAIVETASGAAAIVSGPVTNGGTLFASGSGSLIEIASGAIVNGGLALIGDGIVDIAGSSGESVKFLSMGSGGLELDGSGSAYKGKVSGFGDSGHSNHAQFIDFTAIGSGASVSYTSAASHTSGTLMVTSGGVSATVTLIGTYSSTNFSSSTVSGHVRITDPGVVNGGSVDSGGAPAVDAHSGIDLPNIAFGAQTTLAYAENGARVGGTLTVTDGRHAAAIALLGNYMAGSFFTTADGHGGTLVTETQPQQQTLLTHPQA